MASIIRSILLSLIASVLATVVANVLFTAPEPSAGLPERKRRLVGTSLVVVVPVLAGNSNNRIGWVHEDHYHSLFGRGRR